MDKECQWCKIYREFNQMLINNVRIKEEQFEKMFGLLEELLKKLSETDGLGD